LGQDSIAPFLAYPGKTVFVLSYTSNPSAKAIQEFGPPVTSPLFEHVIRQAQGWGDTSQIAFVVGATQPHALSRFRAIAPQHWVLAPGVGAQGGHLGEALRAGLSKKGEGLIVPVSRGIIYASDPHVATLTLRDEINQTRKSPVGSAERVTPDLVSSAKTDLILQLHDLGCVQFGNFTLASGKQSPLYLDLRRLSGSPTLLKHVAQACADLLATLTFDCLAAVPYAALTIGTAIALATDKPLIYPRKEIKSYGTGRGIEGVFEVGETAVIIEDLVTSGGSVVKAAIPLVEAGLHLRDVVVLIDREQGGRENLAEQGYQLHAVLRLSEILDTLYQAGRISATELAAVKAQE
jgi:uridine monophosphate synthetase